MVVKTLLVFLVVFIVWQVVARAIANFKKFPAPAFTGPFFDSKLRRKFQSPETLIRRSGIKKGMCVLDLGCGSGAFTTSVARTVGRKGKVYAVDIQDEMLKQLEKKLSKFENEDIRNVKLVHASAHELPFENESLDLVFMVGVLNEILDRKKALSEIRRVLKSGGMLAVTELLPDPHYSRQSTTIRMGEEAGFVVDKTFGNFFNYTVRFVKR